MSDHEQRLASLAWYLRMMPKHIRSDDGDHTLIADMAADTVDAAAASIRELEADLDAARAERDKARREALEEMRNECLSAQDWADGSLGWNRACARMEAACRMLIAKEPRT